MKLAAANPVLERPMPESALAVARAQREGLLRHFGFRESPFGVTPDPEFLFWTQMHSNALQAIVSSIESDRGFSVLLGAPGTGKTSLLFHLLALYRESANTAFIFQTQCRPHELIRHIAAELDLAVPQDDEVSLHQKLNAMLIEQARAGRKVLIVIDEAQDLQPPGFEAVRLLSDFETGHSKLLNIVFSGSPQLGAMLSSPELSQLAQRISTIARLEPLSENEVGDYVRFRLAVVSAAGVERPFLPEALAEISGRSRGIPRIINGICYRALTLAYTRGEVSIGRELVTKAAKDFDLSEPGRKDSTSAPGSWPLANAFPANNVASSKSTRNEQPLNAPAPARVKTVTRLSAKRFMPASPSSSSVRNQANALRGRPVPAKADHSGKPATYGIAAFQTGWHRYGSTGLIAALVLIASALWVGGNQFRAARGKAKAQPAQTEPQPSQRAQAQSAASGMVLNETEREAPQNSAHQSNQSATPFPATNSSATQPAPDQLPLSNDIGPNVLMSSKIPSQPATPAEPSSPNTAAVVPTQSGDLEDLAANRPAASPQLQANEIALTSTRGASFSFHPIKVVQPVYPARARLAHMEGEVQVELSIDRDGIVRSARALSGNAILAQAAEDAARQWRYAPYKGGDSITFPKVTRVLFNFTFNSAKATKE